MRLGNSKDLARGTKAMQENLVSRQTGRLRSMREDLLKRQRKVLLEKCRRIAVVGASTDPNSNSYLSIEKFLGLGVEIVPILPGYQDYLGLSCYDHIYP